MLKAVYNNICVNMLILSAEKSIVRAVLHSLYEDMFAPFSSVRA